MTKAIRFLFACVLFVAAVSAVAQGPLRVQVPFDFQANGKTLSAGTYTVSRAVEHQPDVLRINGAGGSTVVLTVPVSSDQGGAKLSFHRYGDVYFLSGVETPNGRFAVPRTREERDAASRMMAAEVVAGSK